MMDFDYTEYVKEEFAKPLVGRTIVEVRQLTKEEEEQFAWYSGTDVPIVCFMDDGSFFIPTQDPECNGPGYLLIEPGDVK
jgi:hypothetical protein